MSHTTFTNGITLTDAVWFNDIDTVAYTYFGNGTNLNSPTKVVVTQGVFSTSVTTGFLNATGYITGGNSPLNPGGLGANRWVIDNQIGQTRLFTYGTNASTNGSFVINSQRSDGTNSLDILTLSGAGSLTIPTSVVTPLVSSNAALRLASTIGSDVQTSPGGGTGWLFKDSSQNLFPNGDNDRDAGGPSNRIARVYTPIIDSGTTGSLFLKTNNGTSQVEVVHASSSPTRVQLTGGSGAAQVGVVGETNSALTIYTRGTGSIIFSSAASADKHLEILGTATGTTRWATISGSNGGNPTLGVTGGSLAITPAIVAASTIQGASTIGVGTTTPSASGAGISFPATQSASTDVNTLDDYEEGSWTPTLGGTATYLVNVGSYTKIGNLVFIKGRLAVNTIGTGSVSTISGLPFTSSVSTAPISVCDTTSLATAVVSIGAKVTGSNTTISFHFRTVAATGDGQGTTFGNGTIVEFAGCYST